MAEDRPSEMATGPQQPVSVASPGEDGKALRARAAKVVGALLLVVLYGCALTVVSVAALQAQVPRNMPFGVTGPSAVVEDAQSAKVSGYSTSWDNTTYADESAVMDAIDQGEIYGAYITGTTSDKLILVPAKSFLATVEIEPLFAGTAAKLGRPLTVEQVKPLPQGKDPLGAVAGLLLLPVVVGGLVAAIAATTSTGAAAQKWRVAVLVGFSLVGVLLTLVIAGPLLGAFAGDRFLPLLPSLLLIEVAVALVTGALLAVLPATVAMLVALGLFIAVGMPTAGTSGTALLPTYWQTIGSWLPPRHGADLIQNVLYFSSNNITTAVVVLLAYALIAGVALGYLDLRARRAAVPPAPVDAPTVGSRRQRAVRVLVVVLLLAAVEQCLFTSNYTSSAHNPVAQDMPFAVAGQSSLVPAVQQNLSLDVTSYTDEAAAKEAIGQADAWGALIPGEPQSTLLVVPTISDLAPLNLLVEFENAAKSEQTTLSPSVYAPTPLAAGDPFGIVLAMLMTPLLISGYMASTMLRGTTGAPTGPYRGLILLGFAAVMSLLVALITGPWLDGFPSDKFWTMWGIMALILLVVGLFAAVMQRLLGALGTLVTVIVIVLFGKPSSGGANGVPYLPSFWSAIGPYLPPQNGYILLRNSVYFDGNGTTQALVVLLVYLVALAVIIGILDWYRRPAPQFPAVSHETEAASAASATPAGVAI